MKSQDDLNTYEVVTEELHDESRVLVALLAQGVELCRQNISFGPCTWKDMPFSHTSNSIIKGKLGEVAGLVRGVQDFVVED